MNERGQSTLDFLLGIVLFLLAVTVVVGFVPGMLDPFVTGTEGHPVTADRAVTTLTSETLAVGESPYVTTGERVGAVINNSTEAELATALGVGNGARLNVTVTNRTGTVEQVGTDPPDTGAVTAAHRVISIDGQAATVTLRVWKP
ncbi:hypothetical protein HTSR_1213 [Halodesulfurarchaeum formicicum]|uniref:Uncharacterized protein n=1 Tax=Halodesulfurarchaeum formicicum TaxID=1873524 RepID=A0A1D8S4V0_9EURY|nr:hypothetical protein [Halodesulfurarchaeum formicicum]AOW80391.1 hypothetical protein HTSR_1213 [Halodesulfurarchaeum formicicum]APE95727.1 hypothetical protein HSR6_1283 [Halodesulfurarchaeum formicicum]